MLNDPRQPPRLRVGSAMGEAMHERAVLLGSKRNGQLAENADSFCLGERQFGKPMIALTTQQKLGPVRHALSQMVVAGTMVTQPPIHIRHGLHHPEKPSGGDGVGGE